MKEACLDITAPYRTHSLRPCSPRAEEQGYSGPEGTEEQVRLFPYHIVVPAYTERFASHRLESERQRLLNCLREVSVLPHVFTSAYLRLYATPRR